MNKAKCVFFWKNNYTELLEIYMHISSLCVISLWKIGLMHIKNIILSFEEMFVISWMSFTNIQK